MENRAIAIYEPSKPEALEALRARAREIHQATGQPVSANDIRGVLDEIGYAGDHRILGAVFNAKDWEPAALTNTTTPGAAAFGVTRQTIQAYRPRRALEVR
jgi:hypothetical protein